MPMNIIGSIIATVLASTLPEPFSNVIRGQVSGHNLRSFSNTLDGIGKEREREKKALEDKKKALEDEKIKRAEIVEEKRRKKQYEFIQEKGDRSLSELAIPVTKLHTVTQGTMNKNTHYLFWTQANGDHVKLRFAEKEKTMAIGWGVPITVIGNTRMGLKYKFWNDSLNAPVFLILWMENQPEVDVYKDALKPGAYVSTDQGIYALNEENEYPGEQDHLY